MRNIKLQKFFELNAPLGFDNSVTVSEFGGPISECIVPGSNTGWSRTAVGNT